MKKILVTGMVLFLTAVISGFFIPVQLSAPPDVRVIVDHTNQIYASPPCFNKAQLSNYLQESDYGEAKELDYEPESTCTSASLIEEDVTMNAALLKLAGVMKSKWSDEMWKS
ncbi:hypothetical protein [Salibacterium aidingense]|uniref:hypothetical protein n=1 Tax=Salibacterium aidingense TaxID=384933 RepID=UPI003BD57314